MFGRLGAFVVRRAWWVIAGWLLTGIAIIATSPSLSDITSADQGSFLPETYRGEAREGREPRDAAAIGVEHAGPTVAAAGLILAGTFAVLLLAPISFLQQMGFAVALGIVLSAFVMALFLVPALTALIGHTAWWPGHSDRARVRVVDTPASAAAR